MTSEQELINQDLNILKTEQEWHRQNPKLSETEWLNIFPEAKPRWIKSVKLSLKITALKNKIEIDLINWEVSFRVRMLYAGKNQEEIANVAWIEEDIRDWGKRNIAECEKKIRVANAELDSLNNTNKKSGNIKITPNMIKRAKEYPIEKILDINKAGFAQCIFHRDRQPSMYCKKNYAYCFTCQRSADTVEILVKRDGYKFVDAVLKLQ